MGNLDRCLAVHRSPPALEPDHDLAALGLEADRVALGVGRVTRFGHYFGSVRHSATAILSPDRSERTNSHSPIQISDGAILCGWLVAGAEYRHGIEMLTQLLDVLP